MAQAAKDGDKIAQKFLLLGKHLVRGQSYSGITTAEAIEILKSFNFPKEEEEQRKIIAYLSRHDEGSEKYE